MKLQKGKWYVCIKSWSDDGWTKFWEGCLLQCTKDDEMTDCYDVSHLFIDGEAEEIFREATAIESNIARSTEFDVNDLLEHMSAFDPNTTLIDIYKKGVLDAIERIRKQLSISDV